jgi:hypothetical protein
MNCKFKVGQVVVCSKYGIGVIKSINIYGTDGNCIYVKHLNSIGGLTYKINGSFFNQATNTNNFYIKRPSLIITRFNKLRNNYVSS